MSVDRLSEGSGLQAYPPPERWDGVYLSTTK